MERMESLRERAERRLHGLGVLNMDYPEHRLEAVDVVLAALGLDDLDAAANRLWDTLAKQGVEQDRFATEVASDELAEGHRAEFRRALEAALTSSATDSTGGSDG